ncbi:MAG TPA: hypothetical protein VFL83_23070 [Anaeromyxobacter sp.]|nr:hypothetical protein [Anaeromyxobacter sp.]
MPPDTERAAARVHWLVAARFGASPAGEAFEPSLRTLDAELARRVPSLEVDVPDRLGREDRRRVALPIAGLRTFTLGGVAEAVPELKALLALAAKPPADPAAVSAELARLAGEGGRLARAWAGAAASPSGAARALRDALEAAVYGTALDVLRSAPVARVESAWRGLRLLLERCPKGADMHVEALDADAADVPGLLAARPPSGEFDDPDAVLVAEPVADARALAALAGEAEALLAPAVAEVPPALLEAADAEELAARLEKGAKAPEGWEALRAEPAARWLCAAVNRVALHSEGAGAFKRTAFGSPVWALGAMLAESYRKQGAFAAIAGPANALAAPAAWTIPAGAGQGVRAPTEAFLPIAAQGALAAAGVVGLGSPRNQDKVVALGAPAVSSAPDAQPLPAQLLAGRIVRFARWARAQIDPAGDPASVQAVMEQAAGVFLFPGLGQAATLAARVDSDGEVRALRVAARVKASHAGTPLSIEFALPL